MIELYQGVELKLLLAKEQHSRSFTGTFIIILITGKNLQSHAYIE